MFNYFEKKTVFIFNKNKRKCLKWRAGSGLQKSQFPIFGIKIVKKQKTITAEKDMLDKNLWCGSVLKFFGGFFYTYLHLNHICSLFSLFPCNGRLHSTSHTQRVCTLQIQGILNTVSVKIVLGIKYDFHRFCLLFEERKDKI